MIRSFHFRVFSLTPYFVLAFLCFLLLLARRRRPTCGGWCGSCPNAKLTPGWPGPTPWWVRYFSHIYYIRARWSSTWFICVCYWVFARARVLCVRGLPCAAYVIMCLHAKHDLDTFLQASFSSPYFAKYTHSLTFLYFHVFFSFLHRRRCRICLNWRNRHRRAQRCCNESRGIYYSVFVLETCLWMRERGSGWICTYMRIIF